MEEERSSSQIPVDIPAPLPVGPASAVVADVADLLLRAADIIAGKDLLSLNPALVRNTWRPTDRDDAQGFGPARINVEKKQRGILCMDAPLCTKMEHETYNKRRNLYRLKLGCRGCVKDAVQRLPAHATHWQRTRYVAVLFRHYCCPFCLLEAEEGQEHLVTNKNSCKEHEIINSFVKCDDHNRLWRFCKECTFDPRSGTDYCLCGVHIKSRSFACICPPEVKAMSDYGIRFNTNPFAVQTPEVKKQEEEWVEYSKGRAMVMRNCADVLRDQLPPKRKRKAIDSYKFERFKPLA